MNEQRWQADPDLRAAMREALAEAAKEVDAGRGDATVDLFEALGTLMLCGAEGDADAWIGTNEQETLRDRAARALDGLDPDELDDAALEFSLAIERLREAADDDTTDLEERIVDSLAVRDRVELVLAGVERATEEAPQLSDELGSAIDSFDEIAEDRLMWTTRLGFRRAARCAWARPEHRRRFWWWSRGSDLPAHALDSLEMAARLIRVFPGARRELELRVEAEELLGRMILPAQADSNLVNLADWLNRKVSQAPLRVAASPEGDERVLIEGDKVSVSATARSLIVDCEVPWDAGRDDVVVLRAEGLDDLVGRPTLKGRYEFDRAVEHLERERARLVVHLEGEDVEVELPPSEA
ncbi:MAG: hypothetical protein R6V85_05010 [Polyangia bacterium]